MAERIRWGIIGPGKIAHRFAKAVQGLADQAELAAIASATGGMPRANEFGDRYAIPRRYASYRALAEDPAVDAVYIATPHSGHRDACLLAIEAGKAVLCEKPFTVNAAQAREVVDAGRRRGVFVLEAMWTRFLPAIRRMQEWVAGERIGELRAVRAAFGYRANLDVPSRVVDPLLAGGALLDVGCYPLHLACALFGTQPASIRSVARLNPRWGVDEHSAILLEYPGGAYAVVASAMAVRMQNTAVVEGTAGRIELPDDWFNAERITLHAADGGDVFEEAHPGGNGFHYQIAHTCACLRAGRTESDILPLDESIAIMALMDRVRAEWGLRYPGE